MGITTDLYGLNTPTQRARFSALSRELRCPVCKQKDLNDSDAPLAYDLKHQIAHMIVQGDSDAQIKDYLVKRYGNFVLFRPPVNIQTWLLWYGPSGLLVGIFALLLLVHRRANKRRDTKRIAW
jgi:cytochrome c-type biogenesis protein CcmH